MSIALKLSYKTLARIQDSGNVNYRSNEKNNEMEHDYLVESKTVTYCCGIAQNVTTYSKAL